MVNLLKGEEAPIHDADDSGWDHPMSDGGGNDVAPTRLPEDVAAAEQISAPVGSLFDDEDEDSRITEV